MTRIDIPDDVAAVARQIAEIATGDAEPEDWQAVFNAVAEAVMRERRMLAPFPGLRAIVAERRRQVTNEGFDDAHDDRHVHGELVRAGVAYAVGSTGLFALAGSLWPEGWTFKPASHSRDLERAGALIAAELDRLHRRGES